MLQTSTIWHKCHQSLARKGRERLNCIYWGHQEHPAPQISCCCFFFFCKHIEPCSCQVTFVYIYVKNEWMHEWMSGWLTIVFWVVVVSPFGLHSQTAWHTSRSRCRSTFTTAHRKESNRDYTDATNWRYGRMSQTTTPLAAKKRAMLISRIKKKNRKKNRWTNKIVNNNSNTKLTMWYLNTLSARRYPNIE